MNSFDNTVVGSPRLAPASVLAWEAVVDVGPRQDLGLSPAGERFIIPILGGVFAGDVDGRRLRGRVLSGGADRQLLRPDGIKELDALYEMQTDDGAVLTIHNRVLIENISDDDGVTGNDNNTFDIGGFAVELDPRYAVSLPARTAVERDGGGEAISNGADITTVSVSRALKPSVWKSATDKLKSKVSLPPPTFPANCELP